MMSLCIFFFKGSAAPRILHSSPTRASPIPPPRCRYSSVSTANQIFSSSRTRLAASAASVALAPARAAFAAPSTMRPSPPHALRSEEHTSELQSRQYLVCRLLLEKKKKHHHI